MDATVIFLIFAILALLFSAAVFAWRLREFNTLALPIDRAKAKGSSGIGILYAYTLGMAPWSKGSTRLHWAAYLRGVAFHLGIFLCLALLLASPWISILPAALRTLLGLAAGFGAIFGFFGLLMRFSQRDLKALSTPDDFFSVFLVSLFQAAASLWLLFPAALPVFYLTAAAMLIYAPFSKIRHCIYFAYSRLFFGRFIGSRAVLPHSQQSAR